MSGAFSYRADKERDLEYSASKGGQRHEEKYCAVLPFFCAQPPGNRNYLIYGYYRRIERLARRVPGKHERTHKDKKGWIILEVKVFDNDVEKALKILKNKLSKSGLFKELKLRRAYEKPSVRRKRKAIEARRRLAKVQRRRHS